MTAKEFETKLRELLHKTPFEPFVVEYTDGVRFWVDGPYVAFSGGRACFAGPDKQTRLFDYKNVSHFLPVKVETPS